MRSFSPHRNSEFRRCVGRPFSRPDAAFNLIEIMVTVVIVVAIMLAVLETVSGIERSWKSTTTDAFAEAQDAFATVTQNLAEATLEPYQDFADSTGSFRKTTTSTFVPDHLSRRSDLAFVCGTATGANGLLTSSNRVCAGCAVFFLAPAGYTQAEANSGMDHLFNAMGYFVEFGTDSDMPDFLLPSAQRWRWRLKEIRQPSESLQVFSLTSSTEWIQQLVLSETTTPILAENVIALIILPERAASDSGATLAPDFRYDSRDSGNPLTRHQLPARLRVCFMAIDEASAKVLAAKNGSNPPALVAPTLFQKADQLDADLASLNATLTAQKINHRLFQREILLNSAAWSNTTSQ